MRGTRASDAERDAAAGELGEHFAVGRLSHDTFLHRVNAALGARHRSELPPLFADLPERRRTRGWLSDGWAGSLVNRVFGLRPGRAHADGGPSPARGQTSGLPAAPGAPGVRGRRAAAGDGGDGGAGAGARARARDGRDARRLPGRPHTVLPFPRGAGTTFSIGRANACDLAIDDPTVSRVHARLERAQDGWLLYDLGSTNGTRVNGWLVREQVSVQAGDLVRFGETVYALGDSARGEERA